MDVETIAINGEWTRHAPHRSDPLDGPLKRPTVCAARPMSSTT